jgi:hypothetical protein
MEFRSMRRALVLTLLVALAFGSIAFAQIRSGTITGTVTDATGAVVAGAEVTLLNQDTNITDVTKTTEAGLYTFPYLPAGTYTVSISMTGFAPFKQTGLVLTTAQTARVDAALKIGTIEAAIEVAAQAAQIQTDTSTVQNAVQAQMIAALPNPTQNPMYYAMLQNGVVPRNNTADSTSVTSFGIGVNGRRQWSAIGVNGGRAFTNDIQLDGLPVMAGGYNEAAVVPNTEGLQEVRVVANNFSAQYGHGQAVVAMSTKSGTNQFHGQADYQLRNEALNANTNSNNANGVYRPAFKVHDMGGAIGGPIKKDKLFFFSSYHYLYHNRGNTSLLTVPTSLEAKGDFSQTMIRDASGQPVPAQIFDPYSITQLGPDLYERSIIPGAVVPNPNPYALKMYTFYPGPNRTPDDAFNTNNYTNTVVQTVRRHSLNNRLDYRMGNHSIYGSGGLSYANIVTPRAFGKAPLNDAPDKQHDKNPYGQIGDTWVIGPTTVADIRFGYNRVNTFIAGGNKEGFTAADYASFGVPKNLLGLMGIPGSAPVIEPNYLDGGQGGGSNWTNLTGGRFASQYGHSNNYNLVGSVTKIRGSWTHKVGAEIRNLQSNYMDFEEGSAELTSQWFRTGGNFNFQYVTANGGVSSNNKNNNQLGVNGAGLFLGAGSWWIRPGANVAAAFSQKYYAVYSQNDWRASQKLTINLGLRWDLQPGTTERYDRMSAVDLDATNAFGSKGAVVFPGVGGYSRNLWDTQWNNWGPRLGAAYQLNESTVVRAGYGITYLPSNTGFFSGPTDYGSSMFSSGTMMRPYGLSPNGMPVRKFWEDHELNLAVGANPSAPIIYGAGEAKFDRHWKNGMAQQWNFFIERRMGRAWFASVGYTGTHSSNLMNRNVIWDNNQFLPSDLLASWRAQYIASNGVTNPANVQITNPFQPANGPLLNFSGALGGATIPQNAKYFPYPLLNSTGMNISRGWADYHSLQLRLSHAMTHGFMFDFNYTWSKELDNTDNMEDNQGFNSGGAGAAGNPDLTNWNNNTKVGFSDIPHRAVATIVYEFPFGKGKAVEVSNPVLRAIAEGWQASGTVIAQAGMPFTVTGANSGALLGRPDRVSGVALEVPTEL